MHRFLYALFIVATLTACTRSTPNDIVIGTTVGDFADQVRLSIKPILESKGYRVKLVEFSDYVRPNLALQEGSIDLNVFQHKQFLENFAKEHKLSLKEIFQVPTPPLGLYPGRLANLQDVKEGTTFAVPNDPSNFARALVMFAELGFIKLKQNVDPIMASERDISENTKRIKLIPLEAAQLPRARADVDFAVINGNFALSSGIKLTDAVYQEKSDTYLNWGVIRLADENKAWAKDVIEAYNSQKFKKWSKSTYLGYKFPQGW